MENYVKGDVVKTNAPDLHKDIVKCSVQGRLHGFVHFAKKQIEEKREVVINGVGGAVSKAVSTAELLKRDHLLHQSNKIYFITITEVWKPKDNEELQDIEVERKVPAITITLQLDEPQVKGPGYQAPDTTSPPVQPIAKKPKFKKFTQKPKDKEDYPFPNHQKEREERFRPRKEGSEKSEGSCQNGKKKKKENRGKQKNVGNKSKQERRCEEFKPAATNQTLDRANGNPSESSPSLSENRMESTETDPVAETSMS